MGCISAYLLCDLLPLPALGLLFQTDVHLMEMLAEVFLLLFLLRKDVEASVFSSQYTSLGVLFTKPGAKLLGSPWPPAAWGENFSPTVFLQPWSVKPALSTQLLPPPQTCQWFSSQIICSSVLIKNRLCELTCLVFQPERWEGKLLRSVFNNMQLSIFTTCSDVRFSGGNFQIWGQSQATVKTWFLFEGKTMETMYRK